MDILAYITIGALSVGALIMVFFGIAVIKDRVEKKRKNKQHLAYLVDEYEYYIERIESITDTGELIDTLTYLGTVNQEIKALMIELKMPKIGIAAADAADDAITAYIRELCTIA